METFAKLFGSLYTTVSTASSFSAHPATDSAGTSGLMSNKSGAITKEVLRKRTNEYHRWVEAFARKR
jgi:hypothetical protein